MAYEKFFYLFDDDVSSADDGYRLELERRRNGR